MLKINYQGLAICDRGKWHGEPVFHFTVENDSDFNADVYKELDNLECARQPHVLITGHPENNIDPLECEHVLELMQHVHERTLIYDKRIMLHIQTNGLFPYYGPHIREYLYITCQPLRMHKYLVNPVLDYDELIYSIDEYIYGKNIAHSSVVPTYLVAKYTDLLCRARALNFAIERGLGEKVQWIE
jgi:hypothetical protein